jgi:RNA polymerase sigma factor (TIGR02999 family)
MTDVTQILNAIRQGDPRASEELLPLVYEELRDLARQRLANEKPGQTLQATALVHEAYLRLVGKNNDQSWDHRGHFFAAAAEAMRRILVESARRKKRVRHGGELQIVDLDVSDLKQTKHLSEILDVDDCLEELERQDQQAAQLVKLRFFAGFSMSETAEIMKISERNAYYLWSFAKSWISRQMETHSR